MMFRNTSIIFLLFLWSNIYSQGPASISLEESYDLLEANYPMLQNEAIYAAEYENTLAQLDKSRLPKLYLKADGRIQSEATSLDVEPGVMIPFEIDLPPYSAKAYLEAQYLILDGGMKDAQGDLAAAQLNLDQQKLEVDRFGLRERVNKLFLSVQLIREQIVLLQYSIDELASRKEMVEAGVTYGVLLESELYRLEVKELELNGLQENLNYQVEALIATLSDLIGLELSPNVALIFPSLDENVLIPDLLRPELTLFQSQQAAVLAQSELIDAARRPKLSVYAQAGTGYPNPLNILDNNIAPYALLGVQFQWQITDWKASKLQKEKLTLKTSQIQNASETFQFNLTAQESAYIKELERIDNQILLNQRLSELEAQILQQVSAQLEEGVIPVSDYISQLNAELRARQNLLIQQTEKSRIQLEFWNQRAAF